MSASNVSFFIAELRQMSVVLFKAYALFILFYLCISICVQGIKESGKNPNHWAPSKGVV